MTTEPSPPQEPLQDRGSPRRFDRRGSAWLGPFLAIDAATLVIVGLFLEFFESPFGNQSVEGFRDFTRIDIVLAAMAVAGALLVLLAILAANRELPLAAAGLGLLIVGQVFPTENANMLDSFEIGFWLVLAGGVLLTVAALVARAGIARGES